MTIETLHERLSSLEVSSSGSYPPQGPVGRALLVDQRDRKPPDRLRRYDSSNVVSEFVQSIFSPLRNWSETRFAIASFAPSQMACPSSWLTAMVRSWSTGTPRFLTSSSVRAGLGKKSAPSRKLSRVLMAVNAGLRLSMCSLRTNDCQSSYPTITQLQCLGRLAE